MKTYLIAIIILVVISISCNKNNAKTGLIGKWKLTEALYDPGDGSGQWTAPSQTTIIEFTSRGIIKYNNNKPSVNYKVLSDYILEISSSSNTISISYELNGNRLMLRPPCIEGCGERYIRLD